MKKTLALVLALLLVLALFAGCNNGSGGTTTPTQAPSSSGGSDSGSGGSGSGSGSGSVTPTVNAPNFSGNTQFEESTQVTMSGPDGAEIHYTTDGSTPTAESTVYNMFFGVNAGTTVKAIAILNGVSSEVASRTAPITPTTSPPSRGSSSPTRRRLTRWSSRSWAQGAPARSSGPWARPCPW